MKKLPEPSGLAHGNKISKKKIKMPTRFILTYVDALWPQMYSITFKEGETMSYVQKRLLLNNNRHGSCYGLN